MRIPAASFEKAAVTRCYNDAAGLTLFGSTPFDDTHKLPFNGRWETPRCSMSADCVPVPGRRLPKLDRRVSKAVLRAGEFGQVSLRVMGLSITRRWAWGAVLAALCSLAHARAPGVPHGAGYAHSAGHVGQAERGSRGSPHLEAYADGRAHPHGVPRGAAAAPPVAFADRNAPPLRGGAGYATVSDMGSFGTYHSNVRRLYGMPGYGAEVRGSMQYAGAITPVSAESRGGPRPPVNAPVRTGSIRADVARYNEERGASRNGQRQSDDPRQPDGSPYRN
jgi:hypothetical protein